MPKMRKLTPGGHEEVEFDVARPETVSTAEALFKSAVGEGYAIMEVSDKTTTPVETFDPQTQADIVAVPQISGG